MGTNKHMSKTFDVSNQPLSFDAESSKKARLDATAFRGRVPVVLAFVGAAGPDADAAILSFEEAHIRFGERRIQLLVVVDAYPAEVAARLGVAVPLITDDGLGAELNAEVDDQGRICSVILGNDGRVLNAVRQLPTKDQASAVLLDIDRLTMEFPDRFRILSDFDENPEEIADPTGEKAEGQSAPSFRQKLSWFTGDRDEEAKALADSVVADGTQDGAVLTAATEAVKQAHGDSVVDETTPASSDLATPKDVIEKL
jgi:hypothetical protein